MTEVSKEEVRKKERKMTEKDTRQKNKNTKKIKKLTKFMTLRKLNYLWYFLCWTLINQTVVVGWTRGICETRNKFQI